MKQAGEILQRHDLRLTSVRTEVIDLFLLAGIALSEPEIEKSLRDSCDRVTIYRTLNTFLEKGIIHKVLDDAGAMKYALCSSGCAESEYHQHDHVHFKCDQCGQTQCLEHVSVAAPALPNGFAVREMNVLLSGVCPNCK